MYVENYSKMLKRCCPDLDKRLAGGAGENQILSFEKVSGIKFPDEYWEMYRHINGESQFTGCFLGFELLSVEAAEGEYKLLLDCPYQVISDKEGVIQEGEYRPGWIPIAHDGSGSFLIMDLNPGPKGTCGQIITLDREQLQFISSLPVKLLRFSKLNLSGIDALAESVSLKSLSFYQITGVSGGELGRLVKLNELELDQTPLEDYSFLEHMVKLKKLEIRGKKLDHLNFLQNMKGLTELHIEKRAEDESGLQYLKNCKRLKVLDYPLSDLRTAALCPAVTSITVDGRDAVHVEALEGSSITSVTMINSDTVLEEIKKYCALRSWGHRGI